MQLINPDSTIAQHILLFFINADVATQLYAGSQAEATQTSGHPVGH